MTWLLIITNKVEIFLSFRPLDFAWCDYLHSARTTRCMTEWPLVARLQFGKSRLIGSFLVRKSNFPEIHLISLAFATVLLSF